MRRFPAVILRVLLVCCAGFACLLSVMDLMSLLLCEGAGYRFRTRSYRHQLGSSTGLGSAIGVGSFSTRAAQTGGSMMHTNWGSDHSSSSASSSSSAAFHAMPESEAFTAKSTGQGANGGEGASAGVIADTGEMATTAVCLVGGARTFEATGPSIMKYVIQQYEPCDVFLHSLLDQDSAKFWAINSAKSIAAFRVFPNCDVDETAHPTDILQAAGSPQGCQGLLQYFRLVEGCLEMVLQRERDRGKEYEWIVRVRVDSYWRAPAPPISTLNATAYTIPYGNDFHGYNDRFGAGRKREAEASMRRLSLMSDIKRANISFSHNSEKAYKMQFVLSKVDIARQHIPFCVLTQRLPSNIAEECSPAVPSIGSPITMDGTKCMPCQLCNHHPNDTVMIPLYTYMSLAKLEDGTYDRASGIQVCNLTNVWVPGVWEQRFDMAVGTEMAEARRIIAGMTHQECVDLLTQMKARTLKWESPSPEAMCLRKKMGPTSKLGEGDGSYNTFANFITASSVIIAPHLREKGDRSWEMAVQRNYGAKVLVWERNDLNNLDAAIQNIGATKIDVLKLSAEGYDRRVFIRWIRNLDDLPVCQVLVTFPKRMKLYRPPPPSLTGAWERLAGRLRQADVEKLNLQLDSCIGGQGASADRCLFFSLKHC